MPKNLLATPNSANSDINLPIEECIEHGNEDIVRVRFLSAHKNSYIYQAYIQFDSTQVMVWYCTCTTGTRTVGCCSHVAVAIWFLGYEHHQVTTTRQPSGTNIINIHYSEDISDFDPAYDDEGNCLYTLK